MAAAAFIWAAVLGWFLFAEAVGWSTVAGAALVAAGCLLASSQPWPHRHWPGE